MPNRLVISNRLAQETSPYLLQHKDNPVHWQPWDDEALAMARDQQKPVFLSIGYSACHWCHVMEHESFEDERIAQLLNERFICIKVDREERPDVDQVYMTAVQLMTGHGGWPMSMFLTPDLNPFFGGTYWPPTSRRGMPGFDQVIAAVVDAWTNRHDQVIEQSLKITSHIGQVVNIEPADRIIDESALVAAGGEYERRFDFTYGGFGSAPKFPQSMGLDFLLRMADRTRRDGPLEMVQLNLDKMAAGGIYDQLGGGFARYSVDQKWLVPHFEKMLYDNALLAHIYVEAYVKTGNRRYADVVRGTLDYVLRQMTDDEGGFYSTEDADSEGEEGKFYVWSLSEVREILGDLTDRFAYVFDVTEEGNFEGKNILNLPKSLQQCAEAKGWDLQQLHSEMSECRAMLLAHRATRVRPALDDKILAGWNGLMIRAMANAGAALGERRYIDAARSAAEFLLRRMRDVDGRLLHTFRHGAAKQPAYLDDYACLAAGFVALHQATLEERWVDEAMALIETVRKYFRDDQPGFFYTASYDSELITRLKDMHDDATPCGNAMLATVLVQLSQLVGSDDLAEEAERLIRAGSKLATDSPLAAGQWLVAAESLLGPTIEVIIVCHDPATASHIADQVRQSYHPHALIAARWDGSSTSKHLDGLFKNRMAGKQPCVYVCTNATCAPPLVGLDAIRQGLSKLSNDG